MVFVHPGWLWLLLLALPLAAMHVRHHMAIRPFRAVIVASLRTLAFILLVLALARPVIETKDAGRTVVAVVDVSGSIADADLETVRSSLQKLATGMRPHRTLKLVTFDSAARQIDLPERAGGLRQLRIADFGLRNSGASGRVDPGREDRGDKPRGSPGNPPSVGSALADALDLAGALVPHEGGGRILLYTDGLETGGDARAVAHRLAERGIGVETHPIGSMRVDEVVLRSVSMPPSASVGATVMLQAEVESSRAADGKLIVRPEETPGSGESGTITTPITLRAGRQTVSCPCPLHKEGIARYTVRLESTADTLSDNNMLPAAIRVEPPQNVLVLEDNPAAPAAAALTALLGEAAKVKSADFADFADAEKAAGALAGVDLLVIADTAAERIDARAQQRIEDAVTNGMGLLVAGGRRAFGPGGYANTPLADCLPVKFSQKVERRDPSATLVVIIDTSGSMGGPRVNLAKEIARLAIARLKPHDKVGIVEFYGSKRWAAPIQPASNAIDIQRALNRLSSSGGTIILPAIEEAYYALLNVRTRTKHVLVLTDGGVEPGAFEPLIRKMADKGITVSTVLVGPGTDSAFLASLAQWGRGRFYQAPDRFNLPEVIVKQTESSLLTPFVEQSSPLVRKKDDPIIDGIDLATAPPIRGYVETEARPTADVVVASGLGHPILAGWQYGLGKAAAFTSQIGGEWTSELARWAPYAKLFSNLARSLGGPRADEALGIRPIQRPGAVELQIDNRMPSAGEGVAAIELTVTGSNGAARRRTCDPIRPNGWNIRLADLSPGAYRADARTLDGKLQGSAAIVVPPIREVTALGPDHEMLDEINAMQEQATRKAAALTVTPMRPLELWPVIVAATLVLFLLNVLIRRLPDRTHRLASPGTPAAMIILALLMTSRTLAASPATVTTAPSASRNARPGSRSADASGRVDPGREDHGDKPRGSPATSQAEFGNPQSVDPAPTAAIHAIEQALRVSDPAEVERLLADACRLTLIRDGCADSLLADLRERARGNGRAARLLAEAAMAQGDLAMARDTLVALTDDAKTLDKETPQQAADAWGRLARVEELLGNDPAALAALEQAIKRQRDPAALFALRARQALILYDGPEKSAGSRALQDIIREHPGDASVGAFCAYLAGLHGDNELAVDLLAPSGTPKEQFHEHLFRGLFLLRMDRPDRAQQEFEQAYEKATLSRDRRFALERIVTSARRAGRLKVLADAWLADPKLAPERLSVLVAILRELGRPDDALRLLQRPAQTPEQRELIESPDFQRELIAVAIEADRTADAEAAYQALMKREPEQVEWRIGLARLRLLDNKRDQALQFFQEAVDRFDSPTQLMALADGARQLALDEPALAAARKAGAKGGAARVRAVLFEADMCRQRGQTDRAIALLKQVSSIAEQDPKSLQPVAEAFERYGDKGEALRLLKQLYEKSKGEDTLLRIAWLLEEDQRYDEAYALWKNLWLTTPIAARMKQAQERMLDIASKSGKLADLAIELEERIADGKAGDRELSLLVDIYTRANDPVSAAEILQDFGRRSGNQAEILKRLARVYLDCEQFGRCNRILRRLTKVDPANKLDYLQQIAMVALERRQPQQAKAALAELAAVGEGDEVVDEFSAGVLDMTGMHEEAAASYGRVLARHPDRIEAFLLWGRAMKDAGQVDRAIAKFQNLVEDAAEDDLFTVAVDGLLNLNAKPTAMRSALRRVYSRIAAKPDKVFLYQLAGDLLEASARPGEVNDVMEQAVVVAGERRGPMLRELMDGAKADGRNDRVIQFGRSLLALGDEMPPQVFIDIGEAMIKEEQFSLAEQVFDRASVGMDFSAVQQRVATCYEDANLPAQADRIIRELLVSEPDNVALLIRSGGLCEQLGRFDRAFEQYDRAADMMLRRLPGRIRPDEATTKRTADVSTKRPQRLSRATNLDEMSQFFNSAGNGLRSAARTPALRDRLLKVLTERVNQEIDSLVAGRSLMTTIDRNPRLDRLARFMRQVAFSLHAPDVAGTIDDRLLQLYPKDNRLRLMIVQARLDWGLYSRAAAFVEPGPIAKATAAEISVEALLADPAKLKDALAKGLDAKTSERLVGLLIMAGRDEEARQIIRAVPASLGPKPEDTASTMIAAAITLNDSEAVRLWMNAWLEACLKLRDGPAVTHDIERCLSLVWNQLSAVERAGVLDRIGAMSPRVEENKRLALDLFRMEMAERTGTAFDAMDRVLKEAPREKNLGTDTLVQLLLKVPPAQRADLLSTMVNAREPADRRPFLLAIAAKLPVADAALADAFEGFFKAAPKVRLDPERSYWQAQESSWNRNRRQPELGRRIAEILLSESPNDPAILVAAAIARKNAGLHDEALPLAKEALDTLAAAKKPSFQHPRMIGDLARILKPADIPPIIAGLDEQQEIEGATAMRLLAKGILLETADQQAEAIAAYRAAFTLAPSERPVSNRLIGALKQAGRAVELSRLLAANLTKATIMEAYEWRTLMTLYCDLYDPINAAKAAKRDETPLAPIEQMRIARMMGRDDEIRTMFRHLYTDNRDSGRFYTPFWPQPPSPGGITGFLALRGAPVMARERMFSALADLPFAEEEYTALLLAAPPEQGDVAGLIDGLLKAATRNNTRARLIASLLEAQQNNTMTAKDRRMILAIAEKDPKAVPASLVTALDEILIHTDPMDSETLTTLARIDGEHGHPDRARRILTWLLAVDLVNGRSAGRVDERFARLNEYVALLPEPQREGAMKRLLSNIEPTPVDEPVDENDAARLERWAAVGSAADLAREVDAARTLLERNPAGYYRALPATIARCEAAAGRFDRFTEMVARTLAMARDDGALLLQVFDYRRMLPPASKLDNPSRYVDAITTAVDARRAEGSINRATATRAICMIGLWCTENGQADKALAVLRHAEENAGAPGEHWLWIADLARAAGVAGKGVTIETKLLEAEALPVLRVPPLLDEIESNRGRAEADKLALRVAGYSDHPAVLKRAIRYAQAIGDATAAAKYLERLQKTSPPVQSSRPVASAPATNASTRP
jgi:Ca-activated chloride channel family protein